jgi:RimJ/RimL family protein N-acetyltransferase
MKPQILLDIPEQFQSDRLRMRGVLPGDGESVFQATLETFDQLKQWFGAWAKDVPTLEATEEAVRKARCDFLERNRLVYNCYLKANDTLIGRGWFIDINWAVPKCMMAYWVRASQQQRGFGHELAQALTKFGMETIGFKRIQLLVDPRNEPGRKLVKKLGYTQEGEIRNYSFDNFGIMRNYLLYSMIDKDYWADRESGK